MKGRFSALAKEENISGVHNIKNLMKKRLPLMVRIAHGAAPVGLRSPQVINLVYFKGTVSVISSDPLCKDSSAFKALSDHASMMFNIFKCDFFTNVNCAFLLHSLYELSELSEVYAFKQKTALLIRYSFNVIFHKNKNLFFNPYFYED